MLATCAMVALTSAVNCSRKVNKPMPIFESFAGWAKADVITDGFKKAAAPAKLTFCKNDLLVVMMF
ncbi:hypothetical protein D3C87_1377800 [compost metagenome]